MNFSVFIQVPLPTSIELYKGECAFPFFTSREKGKKDIIMKSKAHSSDNENVFLGCGRVLSAPLLSFSSSDHSNFENPRSKTLLLKKRQGIRGFRGKINGLYVI